MRIFLGALMRPALASKSLPPDLAVGLGGRPGRSPDCCGYGGLAVRRRCFQEVVDRHLRGYALFLEPEVRDREVACHRKAGLEVRHEGVVMPAHFLEDALECEEVGAARSYLAVD